MLYYNYINRFHANEPQSVPGTIICAKKYFFPERNRIQDREPWCQMQMSQREEKRLDTQIKSNQVTFIQTHTNITQHSTIDYYNSHLKSE